MDYRSNLNQHLADHRVAVKMVSNEQQALMEADDKLVAAEEAQNIIQHVAQAIQQEAHDRIAAVVSRCLEAVFDEPYEFKIEFERKRGRTEANLCFMRGGVGVDPLTASGGGVVDVASFALRLACLALCRPRLRPVVILDEPFRFLSAEYRSRIRSLLSTLSDEMGMQFIMVTHIDQLRCGKVIELGDLM